MDTIYNKLARHIFSEPDRTARVDVDADADAVQSRAEEMDAVPAAERLVSHAFLNVVHAAPGSRIGASLTDILPAVAIASKAFVGDALVLRHTVRTGVAEAAMHHVPAMQERAGGQRGVPGEGRQTAGRTITVNQLEELAGELLRFRRYGRRPVGSCQCAVLCRNQGRVIAERDAV